MLLVVGFYLIRFWELAIGAIILISYWFFRVNIISGRWKLVWPRLIRPLLLLFLAVSFLIRGVSFGLVGFSLPAGVVAVLYSLVCGYELGNDKFPWVEALLGLGLIFLVANSASLALTIWDWPLVIILLVVWLVNYLIANFWLINVTERAESISAIWALVAAEITLASGFWLVFYQIPLAKILVAQSALVITALAYSLSGIYYHYKAKNLNRGLVFEYLSVAVIVFAVLMLLTKWVTTV